MLSVLSAPGAHASVDIGNQRGSFPAMLPFKLACESTAFRNNNVNDRGHVWFEVIPSEDVVKMTNEKGETFSFVIQQVFTSASNARNQFGNEVLVRYPVWIWFQDHGGKWRQLMDTTKYNVIGETYMYAPGGPGNKGPVDTWAPYNCRSY